MATARTWLDDYFGPATVLDDGVEIPKETALDFVGDGVTAADDPTNLRTTITIPGVPQGNTAPWGVAGAEVYSTKDKVTGTSGSTVSGGEIVSIPRTPGVAQRVRATVVMHDGAGNAGFWDLLLDVNAYGNVGTVTSSSNGTNSGAPPANWSVTMAYASSPDRTVVSYSVTVAAADFVVFAVMQAVQAG